MPDQNSAADEHALLQEIIAPLATLGDDAVQLAADVEFPVAFRGYDRLAVDAYVNRTTQLVAELQSLRSPQAAVRRALERVGEQISGILKRAHETAEQITTQSRREAEDRLVRARQEAAQIAAASEQRVKDLDTETDRIWAERLRIVDDARDLAAQLLALAEEAAERFPPAEDPGGPAAEGSQERAATALFDAEGGAAAGGEPDDAGDDGEPEDVRDDGEPEASREPDGAEQPTQVVQRGSNRPEPDAENEDDPDPTAILPPIRDVRDPRPPSPPEQPGSSP